MILRSNARLVTKSGSGKKTTTKYSIKQAQTSFLFIANTVSEVNEHIGNVIKKKEPIQPFLIIIGESILKPKEILIYFDNIKYKFKTLLKAVEICFNFFLFNLNYPIAGKAVWVFIQIYFFKVNCKSISPDVNVLIKDLQK